jgi:hypothetical protein
MLTRRTFAIFLSLIFLTPKMIFAANHKEYSIFKSVFEHLFPSTNKFYGAKQINIFKFFLYVSKHQSFKQKDFSFLLKGARLILTQHPNFTNYNFDKREKVLRDFEKEDIGQRWLSLILYYGLEGMFCDPIYHGNKDTLGWKNFNHNKPIPTAKLPFGKYHV